MPNRGMEAKAMDVPKTGDFAHIGKSVVIKGELTGSEDMYVDGNVDGSIELRNNSLTVGPNAKIKASVIAKVVVIQGRVEGSNMATDSYLDPDAIAQTYLHAIQQARSAWTWEVELRPWVERF